MALSRASLAALIAANIADNTNEAITPALHRAVENALNDSLVNWVDDIENVLTNSINKVPNSAAVYAALAGAGSAPVITVTKAAFDALVLANDLQVGYWYLVTGAYTDGIWSYVWDMLGICISNNSLDYLRTFWRSTTAGTQWLRGAFDYISSQLILFELTGLS